MTAPPTCASSSLTTIRCSAAGCRRSWASSQAIEVVGEAETGDEAVRLARRAATRCGAHGPAHARPRRRRGDQADHSRQPARRRAGVHHVRRRRLGLRGDARRRARLPAQGHQPGGDACTRCTSSAPAARCSARAVAQRVIEFFARPRPTCVAARVPATHRPGTRDPRPARPGPVATRRSRRRLRISDKTVRNHVSNIFAKLAVADRAQAIVRARDAGLGRQPGDRDA